jgi:hypothetical protein
VIKAYFLKLLPVVIVLFTLAVVVIPGTIIGKKLSKKNGKQTSLSNLKKKIRQSIPAPPTDTSDQINLAFYVPVKNDDSPQTYDSGLQKKSTRTESNVSEKPDAISKLPVNGSQSAPSKLKEPSHTKSTVKSEKTTEKSPVRATSRKKALPRSTAETPDIKSPESSSGSLKISIDPPDAPVYLDGEKMSSAEIENGKKMAVGSYTVTARSPGFTPYSKTVQIEPDKTVILSIALKQEIKGNGQLHVFSYPWANLFIDGDLKGTSPTAVPVVLPEGSHKLVLKRDGYKPYSREITVKPGEVVRLQIELDK